MLNNTPQFVWRVWKKTRKISVGLVSFRAEIFNPGPTEYVQLCCPLDRDVLYAVRRQCEWHIHVHLNKVTTSLRSTVRQYEHLTKVTKRGPRFIHTKRYSKMWNFLQTGISLKMIIYNTKVSSKSLHQDDITYTDSWKLRIQPLTPIWPIRSVPNCCSSLYMTSEDVHSTLHITSTARDEGTFEFLSTDKKLIRYVTSEWLIESTTIWRWR